MFEAEAESGLCEEGENAEDEDTRFQRKHFLFQFLFFFHFFEVKGNPDFISYQQVFPLNIRNLFL